MGAARMFHGIQSCNNVEDMRQLAKRQLPGPIFHYIDGAADDEVTYRRNSRHGERLLRTTGYELVLDNHFRKSAEFRFQSPLLVAT